MDQANDRDPERLLIVSYSYSGHTHRVAEAIRWHKQGGIVTFCWRWMVRTDRQADENGSAFTGAAF